MVFDLEKDVAGNIDQEDGEKNEEECYEGEYSDTVAFVGETHFVVINMG